MKLRDSFSLQEFLQKKIIQMFQKHTKCMWKPVIADFLQFLFTNNDRLQRLFGLHFSLGLRLHCQTFLKKQNDDFMWESTALNSVCLPKIAVHCLLVLGSIDVSYCNLLYKELRKGLEGLVLESSLHLLYLATPYDMVSNCSPDWMIYLRQVRFAFQTLIGACTNAA